MPTYRVTFDQGAGFLALSPINVTADNAEEAHAVAIKEAALWRHAHTSAHPDVPFVPYAKIADIAEAPVDTSKQYIFVAFSVDDVREQAAGYGWEECDDSEYVASLSDEQIAETLQRAYDFDHIIWDDAPGLDVEAFAAIARSMFDPDDDAELEPTPDDPAPRLPATSAQRFEPCEA